MPVFAFSTTIDAVSSYVVGGNPHDMDGMEVTVHFDGGGTETVTWNSNIASGVGWSLGYYPSTGNTGGSITPTFLDWKFSTEGNTLVDKFVINAYANQRVFFDINFFNPNTPGSSNGFWAPNIDAASSGGSESNAGRSPSDGNYFTKDYGAEFDWEFTNPLAYQTAGNIFGDIYEMLIIDFTSAFSGDFLFGVDTDLRAGTEIPEPSTMLLFGVGLLGLGAVGRRKI